MWLDYAALAIGLIGALLVVYTLVFIHDIPYQVALRNQHPHVDAIHVGCWLSLFTLHAIWPLLFLWAVARPHALKVEVTSEDSEALRARLAALEASVTQLQLARAQSPTVLPVGESGP